MLCVDTLRAHLHVRVLRACSRLRFLLSFILAGVTAWLQPLDVHVFERYQDWVLRELEHKRLAASTRALSTVEVLGAFAAGTPAAIEGTQWARAFDLAGLRGQSLLSQKLLQRLGYDGPISVLAVSLSAEDLGAVYPRRASVPVDDLFELPLRLTRPRLPALVLPKRARLTVKSRPAPPLPPLL